MNIIKNTANAVLILSFGAYFYFHSHDTDKSDKEMQFAKTSIKVDQEQNARIISLQEQILEQLTLQTQAIMDAATAVTYIAPEN